MKKKFDKFMAFAAFFILLAGISDLFLDNHSADIENYLVDIEK